MPNSLSSIDYIALILYTVYLSGILIGVWMLWRSSGMQRIWGSALLLESGAAVILFTLMGSRYWISGGSEIIDIDILPLIYTLVSDFLPLISGIAIVSAVAYLTIRLNKRGYSMMGLLLPCLLIPALFSVSAIHLISLTDQNKPLSSVSPEPTRVIQVAPGFTITTFKTEPADHPTTITFGPDDNMYIANYNGDIWGISIKDGSSWRYATGLLEPVGLAWHENSLYVASHGKISILHDKNGDKIADDIEDIVTGLPARIYHFHANNGIVFGPDERIYFAVGSTTDSAAETYTYASSILSVEADGSNLRTIATGVRNPYRLAFNSKGDLFATENGPNDLEVTPNDELNHIVEGADYGFPRYFGVPPPMSGTMSPVALFPPHASADGIIFYQDDQFPAEYYDNAFVTLLHDGEVYRVQLTQDANGDYASRLSVFVTGLVNPVDIASGPDGSLYLIDFTKSIIYKVSYNSED